MSLAYIVALISWPLIVIGGLCVVYCLWQKKNGRPMPPQAIRLFGFMLLWVPFIALAYYGHETAANLFSMDLIGVAAGFTLSAAAIGAWLKARRTQKPMTFRQKAVSALAAPIGVIFALQIAHFIAGDFAGDRLEIDGVVTAKHVRYSYLKGPFPLQSASYYVTIAGHDFQTTHEVFDDVVPLSRIHATIGRGSHTLFSAKPQDVQM
jgi:hypothetical protein